MLSGLVQKPVWFNHCHHHRTISESGDSWGAEASPSILISSGPLKVGRHGNSGTLDLPPSASTLWARCLFSETISSWTYLHQLCKSFKSWFPSAWRETNATYRSSCLMLSICRRSSKFPSLWQVHSLLDSSSHESDEASLLNTTAREQVVASCTYANP